MNEQVSRKFLGRFTLVLGFILGCGFGVCLTGFILLQGESPQDAYERGFDEGRGQKDYGFALGYIQGGFDDIYGFDIRLGAEGSFVRAWEADMALKFMHEPYYDHLTLFIDSLIKEHIYIFDSTDTMPAMDSVDTTNLEW